MLQRSLLRGPSKSPPLLLLLSLCVGLCLGTGCTEPPEASAETQQIVQTWEALGQLLAEGREDCDQLAVRLERFHEKHAEVFSKEWRPHYERLLNDQMTSRLSLAQTLVPAHDPAFECRSHQEVQRVLESFFEPLR